MRCGALKLLITSARWIHAQGYSLSSQPATQAREGFDMVRDDLPPQGLHSQKEGRAPPRSMPGQPRQTDGEGGPIKRGYTRFVVTR